MTDMNSTFAAQEDPHRIYRKTNIFDTISKVFPNHGYAVIKIPSTLHNFKAPDNSKIVECYGEYYKNGELQSSAIAIFLLCPPNNICMEQFHNTAKTIANNTGSFAIIKDCSKFTVNVEDTLQNFVEFTESLNGSTEDNIFCEIIRDRAKTVRMYPQLMQSKLPQTPMDIDITDTVSEEIAVCDFMCYGMPQGFSFKFTGSRIPQDTVQAMRLSHLGYIF